MSNCFYTKPRLKTNYQRFTSNFLGKTVLYMIFSKYNLQLGPYERKNRKTENTTPKKGKKLFR